MDLGTARRTLGVTDAADWETIRRTYRVLIRRAHPDIAGAAGTDRAAHLNRAYATLSRARREGRLVSEADGAAAATTTRLRRRLADDVFLLDRDTLVFSTTPDETFRRILVAGDAIAELSYVDRSASLCEFVLRLADGTPASLVFTLQWRAHDATTEAFATLEALDRAESLDVLPVLEVLTAFVPPAD